MGRSFVAWSLANDALRHPEHTDAALRGIDTILDSVLEVERKEGFRAFLLPYGNGRFALQPERSLFVDSEIALTAALRRLVRDDREDWKRLSRLRAALIAGRIDAAPAGLLESYPDEGWTFDHAVALAALYAVGKLDGDDHNREIERVLSQMKHVLIDARTGLLVSSFTPLGRAHDGPEGSTLWMTLHCLQLVDPAFARDQYQRARGALSASLLGFGWAREWPHGGDADVDSGPVVPLLEVSAGSSGLAFIAAASFGDRDYLRRLSTTLDFAAFPVDDALGRKYGASNQVGDAVLLYALTLGPAWEKLR
jgi:hypothetical protein